MDIAFVGLMIGFFALSVALVYAFENLRRAEMSWIYVLSGVAGARDLRLSGHRPALSGEILMSANGYLQLAFYVVVLLALAKPLGAYMAQHLRRPAGAAEPRRRAVRAPDLSRCAASIRRRRCAGRSTRSRCSCSTCSACSAVYALQRLQAVLPLNPARHGRGVARLVVQHGGQLRHQHQLAGLRRRVAP